MLVPSLMAVGPTRDYSWHREMLPDFLWVALMLGRRSDWLPRTARWTSLIGSCRTGRDSLTAG